MSRAKNDYRNERDQIQSHVEKGQRKQPNQRMETNQNGYKRRRVAGNDEKEEESENKKMYEEKRVPVKKEEQIQPVNLETQTETITRLKTEMKKEVTLQGESREEEKEYRNIQIPRTRTTTIQK